MNTKQEAIEIRGRIKAIEEEKLELERKLYSMQKEVMPKEKYGNMKIKVEVVEKDWRGDYLGEVIRITDFLLNEDEKKEHLSIFGSIWGDWKESRHSVGYYRNEYGILQHDGGGWILLKEGIPCSDEEWEAIKAGNIPDKFKTGNIK